MTRRTARRLRAAWVALLALSLSPGCLSCYNTVEPPPPEEAGCQELPQVCKNGVYVVFLHGLDPLDLANLRGVHDHVRSLGFIKTYYGQPYHVYHFEKELRKVHESNPEARFVLIGFSYGAGLVSEIARSVGKEGIGIDLLVYLDGARLEASRLTCPDNVARVLNIISPDRDDSANVPGAENHVLEGVWHFGTATHPQTVRLLERGLGEVAARVPVTQRAAVTRPLPPPLPGWGFLRPDERARGIEGAAPVVEAGLLPPSQ